MLYVDVCVENVYLGDVCVGDVSKGDALCRKMFVKVIDDPLCRRCLCG